MNNTLNSAPHPGDVLGLEAAVGRDLAGDHGIAVREGGGSAGEGPAYNTVQCSTLQYSTVQYSAGEGPALGDLQREVRAAVLLQLHADQQVQTEAVKQSPPSLSGL